MNIFKEHSTKDIEAAIAKGLAELIGRKITVEIGSTEYEHLIGGKETAIFERITAKSDPDFGSGYVENLKDIPF